MEIESPERPRTRAKKACLACNSRRVRCNVLEMQPCQNCVSWNLSCEVGISRRGKYPRRKKKGAARTLPKPGDGATNTSSTPPLEQAQLSLNSQKRYPPTGLAASEQAIHKTVFLGESSPLTCVVDEGRRSPDKGYARGGQKGRLHYSISEISGGSEISQDSLSSRRKLLHDRLTREGALQFPSSAICDTLLQAYFDWLHPCFPILDRPALQSSYQTGTLSPLLLQSILFIGSLFLLSFWRGSPTEERDVRFWLGAAISLAQKKGMHVMSKLSFLNINDQRVWKRIWWALYVRDQQTSAALGLPPRIRDEDCQIADLEPSDFEESGLIGGPSEIFRAPPGVHVLYVIGMAQLARLLRDVVSSQYLPGRSKLENPERPSLHRKLTDWEANLTKAMQFQMPMSREEMFLVDDRTARDLRLADVTMPTSTTQLPEDYTEIEPAMPTDSQYRPPSPNPTEATVPAPQIGTANAIAEEAAINMDWYELFNMEGDDVMGLAGSLSNPDYLNPQNLEFLYRFL
ncbi:hypothetical protein MYU51_008449 [Penicillium brevicompactum]